jgi:hypothetical protein
MAGIATEGDAVLLQAHHLAVQRKHLLHERPPVVQKRHLEAAEVVCNVAGTLLDELTGVSVNRLSRVERGHFPT